MKNDILSMSKVQEICSLVEGKAKELGLSYSLEFFNEGNAEYLIVYIATPKVELNKEMTCLDVESFKIRNKNRTQFSRHISNVVLRNNLANVVKFSYPPILPEHTGFNCITLKGN